MTKEILGFTEFIRLVLDAIEAPNVPINAIHLKSGYKAELFLLRSGDIFRQNALNRRRLVNLGPQLERVYVHAPEDLILNKIQYYSLSHQPKHVRDIASILGYSRNLINDDYLEEWVEALELSATWQEIQEEIALLLSGDR